jgi:HEAT repeat protein
VSTLLKEVSQGLANQGLEVEQDRGGLVVRGEPGGSPTSVWVNEADRIVRAERVIAYPVDDFGDPLGRALDWLNGNRAGVSYSFQESQRAIVARTCWASPNRSPSPSQLHLLVALLDRAKSRDGTSLSRVAEGDADWDDVSDGNEARDLDAAAPAKDPLTLRFTTSRFDPSELEPATQPAPSQGTGWAEPPTRAFQGGMIDDSNQAETVNFASAAAVEDQADAPRPSGGYSREALEELVNSDPQDGSERPGTSRLAFQLAVQQLDQREGHEKQDMTTGTRSPIRRVLRILFFVAISIPICIIFFQRAIEPFVPEDDRFWNNWGKDILKPELTPLEQRQQLPMGKELLEAELREPLTGSETRIEGSLRALGDKKRSVLEDILIVSELSDLRKRAYIHWRDASSEDPLASLKLLKRITVARKKRPEIERYLREAITRQPPDDSTLISALKWSEKTQNWLYFIELLGRPGEGAEVRAKALEAQLPKDSEACLVLRALIKTGFGSPDAIQTLIDKRGTDWCSGEEGRPLLTSLIKKDPGAADGLLEQKQRPLALLGVTLLREANTPETLKKLSKVVYSRKTDPWVRERAAEALAGQDPEAIKQSTWPLVYVFNDRETPSTLRLEVQQTLKSFGSLGVETLERYTTRERSSTRRYAVAGLGAMETPAATERLIERLSEESDARLRRLILSTLADQVDAPVLGKLLERKLIVFLRLSKSDRNEQVRQDAAKLYRTLAGR